MAAGIGPDDDGLSKRAKTSRNGRQTTANTTTQSGRVHHHPAVPGYWASSAGATQNARPTSNIITVECQRKIVMIMPLITMVAAHGIRRANQRRAGASKVSTRPI